MNDSARIRRLWIAATEAELSCAPGAHAGALVKASPDGHGQDVVEAWQWRRQGDLAYLVSGCGPALAAAGLAWFLGRHAVEEIVALGIAGALPGSPCRMGGVYRVATERAVDVGAEQGDGSVQALPFEGLDARTFELACPRDLAFLPAARGQTTCLATGTGATALRRRLSGADLESMEGAAWAEVAARFGIPLAQVRAISNVAGPRNPSSWKIRDALAALEGSLSEASR